VYGEGQTDPEDANLRGKVVQVKDGAGVVTSVEYDFKGNLLESQRQLAQNYSTQIDWSGTVALEAEVFAQTTAYDALNRPTSMTTPDQSEIKPTYNEASLLEKVEARIRGASGWTTLVDDIDYDVKGQREKVAYGNGVVTEYSYDPLTYRLTRLKTTRISDSELLQDLRYTYDPVGNIVEIADLAQEELYHNSELVEPAWKYEYDAIYRLIEATGREHSGQNADVQQDQNGFPLLNAANPNDPQAMRNYTESFEYDAVGNILKMIHAAQGSTGSWTRRYDIAVTSNRLLGTSLPGDVLGQYSATYSYDEHGSMTTMPHLDGIAWDLKDQKREVDKGGGGTVYFTYDAGGQRVRKVWEHGGIVEERIYLGGFEVYRRHELGNVVLERETLHVMDDARRIAMVETKTVDTSDPNLVVTSRVRYQLGNHLGSAALELDHAGAVISYEEYHPYGTSAYHAVASGVEVSAKRYRYTGKERDEETGLYYHGARYYAPWLGRWTSVDPKLDRASIVAPYAYSSCSPILRFDPDGREDKPSVPVPAPAPGVWRTTAPPPPGSPPGTPEVSLLDSPARRAGKAAEAKGAEYGRQYGEYLAWIDNLTGKLSEKHGGVSVIDRMTPDEKQELANKILDASSKLPALPEDLFADAKYGLDAAAGFNRGVRETYETEMSVLGAANIAFSVAKFVLPAVATLLSNLGRKVVLDFFGGRASQVRGAINVDITAEQGIRADILKGVPLKTASADEILATNPFIPGLPNGSNAMNTWLPEAARVLKPGGRITVTGNLGSNKFARLPSEEDLQRLGLKLVRAPGPVTDPRLLAQTLRRIDGKEIKIEALQSYVLEKL
ncbi:RHS repeat-associated core domain-containing protein, partial [Polyangium fumosum]